MITVIYLPNPFKPTSRVVKPFTPDEAKSLADLQKHFDISSPDDFIWAVNGKYIDAGKIDEAALQALDFVVIAPKIRGGGGGGKNVIALVAGIALMAFTGGAGAGLMGILGSSTGTLGLGLALYGGGSLLMGNQKMPKVDMPTVSGAFEGGYNWSPDTIRVQPGTPIPITFGSMKTSGQLISRRIRSGSYAGKPTQYLDLLLCAGEGPLSSITDVKINDIPIASVGGASYEVKLGENNQTENILSRVVEYQGFSSELPISETVWVTKAQSEAGANITLDFCAPAGLYGMTSEGAQVPVSAMYRLQYREIGSGSWIDATGTTMITLGSQNTRRPHYFQLYFTPPDASKLYEFRAQNYSLKYYNDTYWGGAYTETPATIIWGMTWLGLTVTSKSTQTFPGVALVAISLPATENLSGSMPKVSWTQTRANIYAWNPTAAAYQAKDATNIAWMVYDLIHQCKYLYNTQTAASEYVAFGEAKEKIDYAAFDAWATFCGAVVSDVGRCVGNMLLDSADQLWPIIQKIASSGRGFVIQQAGVFKPVWDAAKTVSQIFTAGNIINGSIKGGFLSESERATAIEASFINQDNGYERDTLFVSNSGFNPAGLVNPTQVFFYGLTDPKVVFRAARHLLRKNQYLKRTLSFQADIDSIVSEIGDVIGVQSDITDWGVGGRVLGATTTSVVIDQTVTLAPGTTYGLLVRFPDGTLIRKAADAVLTPTTTSTLSFTGDPWATAPERFSVYSFGVNTLETKPFQITSITRNGDLQATIECLEYVAGVYADDADFPIIDYTAANAAVNTLTVNADPDTGRLYVSWSLPEDKDYTGSIVYIDGKPQGFFTTEQTGGDFTTTPGTHTVTVVPIGAGGRAGTGAEEEITLGDPTLAAVSEISLSSTVRGQADGTNLVYITGAFTIPDLANSVLVEIGEGSNPAAWATVQDSRVAAVQYGPVLPGTLYTLRFTAKNRYATADAVTEPITTTGDTTAPNAPSIGVTSYLKTVTIQISLASVPSDMAGFAIYRHTANNSAAASQIGSITSKDGRATYTDEAPAYGQTYYYWVKSFDTWGNLSSFSDAASTLITAISGTDIVDGALARSSLFAAGVVDATAIATAAVTAAKTAIAAIDASTGNIVANAVGELQLANDAVTAAKLNVAGIDGTTGAIAAGAVAELQLANDAVTAAKLNVAAIDGVSGAIVANAVGELQLASNAVTAAKIKAGEVGADALAVGAVTELKLANDAVTAAKLNVAAIDGVSGAIVANAVGELQIAADAVTATKINVPGLDGATGAVAAGAVAELQLAAAAVTEAKIATAAVNTAQINNAALKAPLGAVLSLSAKNCTAASVAEANGVRDVSGQGNHGQAYGGVAVVDSVAGKAFQFDGSDDYIEINNPLSATGLGDFTISLWAKSTDYIAQPFTYFSIGGIFGEDDYVGPWIASASFPEKVYVGISDTASHVLINTGLDGQHDLTHIVMVRQGSALTAYLNGIEAGKITTGADINISTASPVIIGSHASKTVWFHKGLIFAPKIFQKALSAAEVKSLYMFPEDAVFGNITADLVTTGELITKTAQIKDAIISSAKIDSLDAAKITTGTLAADRIATGSLAANKITGGALVVGSAAGDVNAGATTISGGKITASSVTASQLASDSVTTDKLAAGAVTAAKVTSGELITLTAQIKDAVITSAKIGSLDAAKITTGTLAADRIAAGSLAADKITGGALVVGGAAGDVNAGATTINGGKITASSVTASQLASDSVTADKIQAGAVTATKVTSGELITLTAQIKDAVVTSAKISDLSADKINAGTLAAARIAAGSLTADKITGGALVVGGAAADVNAGTTTINGGQITASSVTASQLASDSVTTDKLAAGSVTSAKVTSGELITLTAQIKDAVITSAKIIALDAAKITTGSLDAARIAAGSITGAKIAASTITSEHILIGKAGSALNDDPGFEDSTAWINHPEFPQYPGATIATTPTGRVGAGVMRGNGPTEPVMNIAISAKYIPIDLSKTYRLRVWARKRDAGTNDGDGLYFAVTEYDASKARLNGAGSTAGTYLILAAKPTTDWTEYYGLIGPAVSPAFQATTAYARISCILDAGVTAGLGYEIQDFRLEEVLSATLIQDGAIITDKLAANAVTAAKVSAGAIETAALAAGAVTADKIAVGGGGAALNPDPSFMDASEWSQPQMITTITDGVVGSKTMAASTSGLSVWNVKPLPFDKSKTYRLRVQARAGSGISTPSFTMYAYPCSTTGTIDSSYGVSSGSKSLTTSWAAFEYVFAGSAMAGSAQCQLRIRLNPSFSGTGAVQFQDFRIEEVIPGTLIQDGAITTDKLTANSVTAAKIATDAIKSTNYSTTAGSFFDLANGDLKLGGSSAPKFSFTSSTSTCVLAGFTIDADDMTAGSGSSAIGISTDTAKKAFWAGNATPASAKFFVNHNGTGRIGLFDFSSTELSAAYADATYDNEITISNLSDPAGDWIFLQSTTSSSIKQTQIRPIGIISGTYDTSLNRISGINSTGTGQSWPQAVFKVWALASAYCAFHCDGNAYFEDNVSAASFTDRTEMPESMEEALEIINTMQPTKGKVDYKRLSNKAKHFTIKKHDDGTETVEEGRDLTKTVSALVMVCQKLQEEVIRLQDKLQKIEKSEANK